MFGKRSNAATDTIQRPPVAAPPAAAAPQPPRADGQSRVEPAPMATPPSATMKQLAPVPTPVVKAAPRVQVDQRSEDYYQIKTLIFSALIDTIDLAQLAQLDPDSAREEIR